jgi:hypothetical protein
VPACNGKFTTKQPHERNGVRRTSEVLVKKSALIHLQNPTGKHRSTSILWERRGCYIYVTNRFTMVLMRLRRSGYYLCCAANDDKTATQIKRR